jgi:hypothetical protein
MTTRSHASFCALVQDCETNTTAAFDNSKHRSQKRITRMEFHFEGPPLTLSGSGYRHSTQDSHISEKELTLENCAPH